MNRDNGIVYIVFGDNYRKMGEICIRKSRENTDTPFHVFTNMSDFKLDHIPNTTTEYLNIPTEQNRVVKTQLLPKISPFKKTLYLDCDTIIQNHGVEIVFELLDGVDMCFFCNMSWIKGDKVLKIYKRAMDMFKCNIPITVWQGGVFAFNKTDITLEFFKTWHRYWIDFGRAREMPCLACAVHNTKGLKIHTLPESFFAHDAGIVDSAIVQHDVGYDFDKKFGIPAYERNEPGVQSGDFTWVEM